jgi:hypothetical protein
MGLPSVSRTLGGLDSAEGRRDSGDDLGEEDLAVADPGSGSRIVGECFKGSESELLSLPRKVCPPCGPVHCSAARTAE